MTRIVTYIDPPSGWKYGFPKIIPEGIKDHTKWIIDQGYPKRLADSLGDHFYCRYWNEELNEDDAEIISNINPVRKLTDDQIMSLVEATTGLTYISEKVIINFVRELEKHYGIIYV